MLPRATTDPLHNFCTAVFIWTHRQLFHLPALKLYALITYSHLKGFLRNLWPWVHWEASHWRRSGRRGKGSGTEDLSASKTAGTVGPQSAQAKRRHCRMYCKIDKYTETHTLTWIEVHRSSSSTYLSTFSLFFNFSVGKTHREWGNELYSS